MDLGPPLLQREPDARRAPVPAFSAEAPIFIGLLLGAPVAAAAVVWNAAWMRRPGLIAAAVALGVVGSAATSAAVVILVAVGSEPSAAHFAAQLVAVGVGGALTWLQRSHIRGHRLIGGETVNLLYSVGAGVLLTLRFPGAMAVVRYPWLFLLADP